MNLPNERRWTAKVNGQHKEGTVISASAEVAAEAWAYNLNLMTDSEIEVMCDGKAYAFTVECECIYTAYPSPALDPHDPHDEPNMD